MPLKAYNYNTLRWDFTTLESYHTVNYFTCEITDCEVSSRNMLLQTHQDCVLVCTNLTVKSKNTLGSDTLIILFDAHSSENSTKTKY